jgi:hypothetical protein
VNAALLFEYARRCEGELRAAGVPGIEISAILGAAFIGSLDNLPPRARQLVIVGHVMARRRLLLEVMAQPGRPAPRPVRLQARHLSPAEVEFRG